MTEVMFEGPVATTSRDVVAFTSPVRDNVEPETEAVRNRYPALAMIEDFEGEVKFPIGEAAGSSRTQ